MGFLAVGPTTTVSPEIATETPKPSYSASGVSLATSTYVAPLSSVRKTWAELHWEAASLMSS